MITKRQSVLMTDKEFEFLTKFEALEFISKVSEIQAVWERNKTPIMVYQSEADIMQVVEYNVVKVPHELIGKADKFIEFCHKNGFECGEYKTGEIFDTKYERCFLCEIAKHKGFKNLKLYNQFVEKTVDCIIYESPKFYVTLELGALKKGYLMIVPKEHILSVAQFPIEFMPEYQEVCEDIEKILLKAFNGKMVSFMEHGSGPSGKTSHKKSIVHAHTHVVVDFKLKPKYQKMVKMVPCEDIHEAKDVHYFSYQEGSKGQLMISKDPRVYVQRQFPRQIMAEELGYAPEQYNWRKVDFIENIDATLFHIYKELANIDDERIKSRTREFVNGFHLRLNDNS